jgi:hypothetical protein
VKAAEADGGVCVVEVIGSRLRGTDIGVGRSVFGRAWGQGGERSEVGRLAILLQQALQGVLQGWLVG